MKMQGRQEGNTGSVVEIVRTEGGGGSQNRIFNLQEIKRESKLCRKGSNCPTFAASLAQCKTPLQQQ